MSAAEVCRRLEVEVFEQGDLAAADELVHPDFVDHEAPPWIATRGPDAVRGIVGMLRSGLSDLRYRIDDTLEAGDRVAIRVLLTARHTGEFFGIPATGRDVAVKQVHWFRVADGQVIEHWAVQDDLTLMQQLGAVDGGVLPGRPGPP